MKNKKSRKLKTTKWHILLLVFVFIFFQPLKTLAQNYNPIITLNVNDVKVEEVFNAITTQVDVKFFYSSDILKNQKKVTINLSNSKLNEVLIAISKQTNLEFKQDGKTIAVQKSKTKTIDKVKGQVLDSSNEPIIGATVINKNNNNGTLTDIDGNWSLEAAINEVLEISFIGYQTEKKIYKGEKFISLNLKDDIKLLDEVVVVGYGTQKKVNLTGAVGTVDTGKLKNRPGTTVSQMLQGVVPGLTITPSTSRPGGGASDKINIRGVASIGGGGNPLVIIDGIEGDLSSVNPNDIDEISVLKDASSSSVYGARATYGVILVTTKTGKKGDTKVSYSGKFGWGRPTTSTKFETRGYYSVWLNDLFYNSYAGQNYTNYTEEDYNELWIRRNDKTEHPDRPWVTIDQRTGRDTYVYYGNTDWYHHIFKDTRPTQKHDISLTGGTEKVRYYISGGLATEEGIFKVNPDQNKRVNFRSKLDFDINKWLTFSSNINYYNTSYSYPGPSGVNTIFSAMQVHALASFVPQNPDNSYVYETALSNYQIMDGVSAILDNDKHKNKDQTDQIGIMSELTYKPLKNLIFKANFNYTYSSDRYSNRQTNVSYSRYPNLVETLTTGRFEDKLAESNRNYNKYVFNLFGTYNKSFLEAHNFKLMLGTNWENDQYKTVKATGWYLMNDEANDLSLLGESEDGTRRTDVSGGRSESALFGVFGRLNYDYKGKYLLELGGRYDGTSRFHRDRKRWGFFPSGSIGWRVSDEEFYQPMKTILEDLKLRMSYGSLGNQQVGAYDFAQFINIQTQNYLFGGNKPSTATITPPLAGNYTWEKAIHYNWGIDLSTLNNRLTFNADYYIRDTKDMLTLSGLIPATYGTTAPKTNSSNLRTRGYELSISWRDQLNLLQKPFHYQVGLTFNDYKTEITKYDNPGKSLTTWWKGQRYGEIWGYKTDGFFKTDEEAKNYDVDQTAVNFIINNSAGAERGLRAGDLKFVDLNGDGIISRGRNTLDEPGDRTVIGNTEPRYIYGASLGASWAGFDISTFFQGIGRRDWYPPADAMAFWGPYSRPYATLIPHNFHRDIWSEDNPNAYFPRPRGYVALQGNDRELAVVNDKYLQSLAYCRLKNLTIGYTLPNTWTRKTKIEHLRIYFSGENLFTWKSIHSDYIDPEQAVAQGRARTYPFQKTYTVGIDLTF